VRINTTAAMLHSMMWHGDPQPHFGMYFFGFLHSRTKIQFLSNAWWDSKGNLGKKKKIVTSGEGHL